VDFTSITASVTGDTVWAFGSSGIIYRNMNYTSWERYSKGSTNDNTGGTYRTSKGYMVGKGGDARMFDDGAVPDTTVGISVNVISMFNVFPNPSSDMVTIKGYANNDEKLVIELRDMNGRKVETITNTHVTGDYNLSYNVSKLRQATYFVHVNQGPKTWVHRLVVVR
jgi:hypothetical protein